MATTRCKYCGEYISFKRTIAGNAMPVNVPAIWFIADKAGRWNVLDSFGDIVRGRLVDPDTEGAKIGYVSHFGECHGRQ